MFSKIHKLLCSYMRNDHNLFNFNVVKKKLQKLLKQAEASNEIDVKLRLLEYCLPFAEVQYGDRSDGQAYRERNGNIVDNYDVDILTLYKISSETG